MKNSVLFAFSFTYTSLKKNVIDLHKVGDLALLVKWNSSPKSEKNWPKNRPLGIPQEMGNAAEKHIQTLFSINEK